MAMVDLAPAIIEHFDRAKESFKRDMYSDMCKQVDGLFADLLEQLRGEIWVVKDEEEVVAATPPTPKKTSSNSLKMIINKSGHIGGKPPTTTTAEATISTSKPSTRSSTRISSKVEPPPPPEIKEEVLDDDHELPLIESIECIPEIPGMINGGGGPSAEEVDGHSRALHISDDEDEEVGGEDNSAGHSDHCQCTDCIGDHYIREDMLDIGLNEFDQDDDDQAIAAVERAQVRAATATTVTKRQRTSEPPKYVTVSGGSLLKPTTPLRAAIITVNNKATANGSKTLRSTYRPIAPLPPKPRPTGPQPHFQLYICSIRGCVQTFATREELYDHKTVVHGLSNGGGGGISPKIQITTPLQAKPSVTIPRGIKREMITEEVPRPDSFSCTFPGCGRSFRHNAELTIHSRVHSGAKPYKCKWPGCRYEARQLGGITTHIRIVHFRLPKSQKEQQERGIIDDRDPRQYMEIRQELL